MTSLISALSGCLELIGPDWVDVNVGGVTFRVLTPTSTTDQIGKLRDIVRLVTSVQVRQESITIYGFLKEEDRLAFETLIGISGVGPKLALNILSRFSTESLATAVAQDDITAFTSVSGVGKRTASRILLELKGKLQNVWEMPTSSIDNEVLDALTALGYSVNEAREAIASLPTDPLIPLEDKVRLSLQSMTSD